MVQVIPGAEAWSSDGGDAGVLLIHGFTGNPVSLRPLAECLAGEGFAIELPRLPGHGTRWQEMAKTRWPDWAREVVAAFETLRARTRAQVVCGLSMGATLALYLAASRPTEVAGLAVINPSIATLTWQERITPLLSLVLRAGPGLGNDISQPGGDEKPYPRSPMKAGASVIRARNRVRATLGSITAPLLMLTSRQDHVVPVENSRIVLDAIGSSDKRQVWLEQSYHVATLDYDADLICQEIADFTRRVTGGPAKA